MIAKKNGLDNFLSKVIAARDKTNDKLETLAIESNQKYFSRTSADLYDLTLQKFIEDYQVELADWIETQTKPPEGSYRARREVNYDKFKICNTAKYNVGHGYFQLGEELFKIHWIRQGSPYLKGIALDMGNFNWEIRYGSGEDEILSPIGCVLPSVIHALYKSTTIDRRKVFELWTEIFEYVCNALQSVLLALTERPQATLSERFQFEGASFVVTVNSFRVGENPRVDLYMTVTKDAEFENLLSHENINQLATSTGKSDSEKNLGITREEFIKNFNDALPECAPILKINPPAYYNKFIIDNNAVEEFDSENGHIVYFKLGEKNIKLGYLERENFLAAIFYSERLVHEEKRIPEGDSTLLLSVMRALYKHVDFKSVLLQRGMEILSLIKEAFSNTTKNIRSEAERAVILDRTSESSSTKTLQFESEIFFVKVKTHYDNLNKIGIVTQCITITRDVTLENIFNRSRLRAGFF